MGTHTPLAPLYAYAPRGQRAFFKVPRNRGKNTILLAGIGHDGMSLSKAVEGFTTKEVFENLRGALSGSCVEAGAGGHGQLWGHKGQRVRELIKDRGCDLIYLPPHPPDLNPLEDPFAKA